MFLKERNAGYKYAKIVCVRQKWMKLDKVVQATEDQSEVILMVLCMLDDFM